MTLKSNESRRRRGPRLCQCWERDIVNSEYGAFPRKEKTFGEGTVPSSELDQYGDSPQHLKSKEQIPSVPPVEPIGDTDARNGNTGGAALRSFSPKAGKKKSLSRFLFARSKLFQKKKGNCIEVSSQPNLQTDSTVVYEDILNASPDRQRNRNKNASTEESSSSGNPQLSEDTPGACEDGQISNDDNGEKPKEPAAGNEMGTFPIILDADNTASRNKKVCPPPLMEIMKLQRRNSGSSDVSSLSGAGARGRDVPLEYFLALDMGKKQESSNSMFMDDILNIAEHRDSFERDAALQLQKSQSTETSGTVWEPMSKCLILLTDPMQRIFEMVPVLYAPKKDTVAAILGRCTKNATDHRLKKQLYVGLAYGGEHCSLRMLPKDVIRRSLDEGKPLMAIPAKYSAHQIELVGQSLLSSQPVQRLLEKQLESIGCPPKEPELPVTQIVVPPRRSSRVNVVSA
ncbi:unnamed protein product [Cylindrotheca closterium]|uniref:Uncharacterized protein n=1 Tax=Cylindrotheca closterium TaxID=2856 RepID=A0AAD2PWQ2_9STRA|nr:unnamed protein product [Cylindrotheca closterium]